MKIQIATVGGQTAPVFSGINYYKPQFVYLLHTPESIIEAKNIHSQIDIECNLIEIDPIDIFKIEKVINNILNKHRQDDVINNITAGTKAMALTIYNASLKFDNVEICYIDQNNKIIEFKSRNNSENFNSEQNILGLLKDNNSVPTKYYKLENFEEEDYVAAKTLRKMFETDPGEFIQLINLASNETHKVEWKTKKGSVLKRNKSEKSFEIFFSNKKKEKLISSKINNLVISNGWFELEVASILKKWKNTNEMLLNTVFKYEEINTDKNEIDIIVRYKNKLIFIECKLQVYDIKDIDKFSNAAKHYGGLGAKKVLITDQVINQRVAEKCKDNNIQYFDLKTYKNFPGGIEKGLFYILETELLINNKK